jgi:hypothetical protein
MTAAIPRAVMALAVSCLAERRREWGVAMQVEFEAARLDGKPLTFAMGCLMAALRELPAHAEGRFAIVSHLLALGLIVPAAALLLASILADFPLSYFDQVGTGAWLDVAGGYKPLLSDANRSAVPPLAALMIVLSVCHLRIAWLILEREWERVAALAALSAATTVTLVIFTTVVFAHAAPALADAAMLAIELTAILDLARWHSRSLVGSAEAFT